MGAWLIDDDSKFKIAKLNVHELNRVRVPTLFLYAVIPGNDRVTRDYCFIDYLNICEGHEYYGLQKCKLF